MKLPCYKRIGLRPRAACSGLHLDICPHRYVTLLTHWYTHKSTPVTVIVTGHGYVWNCSGISYFDTLRGLTEIQANSNYNLKCKRQKDQTIWTINHENNYAQRLLRRSSHWLKTKGYVHKRKTTMINYKLKRSYKKWKKQCYKWSMSKQWTINWHN